MSPAEALLARSLVVLAEALPQCVVVRRRVDPFEVADLPAVEILRGGVQSDAFGERTDKQTVSIRIALLVVEAQSIAETQLDALHAAAHAALLGDAALAALCRGLRCTGTADPEAIALGDGNAARMECTYEAQALSRRADLTHVIN